MREEETKIDGEYEKKYKQLAMEQQISRSNVINKTRLEVLAAKQEAMEKVYETAQTKVLDVQKDKSLYSRLLQGLILEGLFALSDSKVSLRIRKQDASAVKSAIEGATAEYSKVTNENAQVVIDENSSLPEKR